MKKLTVDAGVELPGVAAPYRPVPAPQTPTDSAVVPKGASLPDVCLKCGRTGAAPWVPVRLPRSRVPYAVPLCAPCAERRAHARKVVVAGAVLVGIAVVGAPLNARSRSDLIGVPATAIAIYLLVYFFGMRRWLFGTKERSGGALVFTRIHPLAAEAISRRP